MIVVEGARNKIGKDIVLSVTSSLQTSAGKMIFGRFESFVSQDSEGDTGGNEGGRRHGFRRSSPAQGPASTPNPSPTTQSG